MKKMRMQLWLTLLLCSVPTSASFHSNLKTSLTQTRGRQFVSPAGPRASSHFPTALAVGNATPPRRDRALFLSSSDELNEKPDKRKNINPLPRLIKLARTVSNVAYRLAARFRGLSKRAQRILVAQAVVLVLMFGAISRNVYVKTTTSPSFSGGTRRSIEVSYSSFMDLVEEQPPLRAINQSPGKPILGPKRPDGSAAAAAVPVMDNVRIGSDRIMYQLRRPAAGATPLETSTTTSAAPPAKRGLLSRTAPRQQRRPDFVTAYTRKVPASPELVQLLRTNGISFSAAAQPSASVLALTVRSFLVTFYFLILWRLYQTVSGAGGGGSAKDAPGKLAQASELPMASFDDIQGIDESKQEVMELVDTLRNPEKYAILGARAPTGLLLEGPPGTGKTMLARATAATAGVPLLYCSGSDFVEMFVGRGAARVRKLFERAARLAPCIIFIDELDALGKARDVSFGGVGIPRSNDEAEQTLNQLLACMDGLDSSRRICVLAATNRKDVLDQALIRPGRFDRIVKLRLPDSQGREKILRVHCQKLPGFREGSGVDPNRPGALGRGRLVDLGAIAAVTDGFSGAELEFLVNEAAIRAVRRVSSALRQGVGTADITPHVGAEDFEASLVSFYETRRPKSGVSEIWKNLLK